MATLSLTFIRLSQLAFSIIVFQNKRIRSSAEARHVHSIHGSSLLAANLAVGQRLGRGPGNVTACNIQKSSEGFPLAAPE